MKDNYAKIAQDNLKQLYSNLPNDLARNPPGEQRGERFIFDVFGKMFDRTSEKYYSLILSTYSYQEIMQPCKYCPDTCPKWLQEPAVKFLQGYISLNQRGGVVRLNKKLKTI